MNRESRDKIDNALFDFYLEADVVTIIESLKENVRDYEEYSKNKERLLKKLKNMNKSIMENSEEVLFHICQKDVDSLSYFSKIFSIHTTWDGGIKFSIHVFDENKKIIVEVLNITMDCKNPFDILWDEVERLKTKYIFDYEKVLCVLIELKK